MKRKCRESKPYKECIETKEDVLDKLAIYAAYKTAD